MSCPSSLSTLNYTCFVARHLSFSFLQSFYHYVYLIYAVKKKIDRKVIISLTLRFFYASNIGTDIMFFFQFVKPDKGAFPITFYNRCYLDRKSTRLNSSHANISYAVFCLKKKNTQQQIIHNR